MDYRRSLDYLYGLQRFGIKLGLENVRALLERLGHPERGLRIVHVGGTNGKGSVSATLAEVLKAAGFRVGLYTSPHLHSFTERIQVDGAAIDEAEVARLTETLRSRAEGIPATFFEFTTVLALEHFRNQQVDFAILEVGMGGRLDATNAVVPWLSVITPVCRDHGEHLGATLPQIAAEKAGIIKERVPVVVGCQAPEALAVLEEQAWNLRAPLLLLGRDFATEATPAGLGFRGPEVDLDGLRPSLEGAHQVDNLSVALAAAGLLRRRGIAIPDAALRAGAASVRWPGRLEWWRDRREVLLDGAHNEGGAAVLAAYLETLGPVRVRWVVAVKGERAPADILGPLLPRAAALYATVPPVEEAVDPAALVRLGETAGVPSRAFAAPEEALAEALRERRDEEIVLVAGSLFLVAAARHYLSQQEKVRP